MVLTQLDDLLKLNKGLSPKKIAVAAAEDEHVLKSLKLAIEKKLIIPVLVGEKTKIKKIASAIGLDISTFEIHEEASPKEAALTAVRIIHSGEADILMKGMVTTAHLLKAVLNKDFGLKLSTTLSHLAIFELHHYHKLLGISDAAMNIAPSKEEKVAIVNNAVSIFNGLGYTLPKVAALAPLEIVNPKIESTTDAALLSAMNRKGQIKNCLLEGPYALDIAVSKEAAGHKKIDHPVAGDADILITPDLNSGNILYKSLAFLGGGVSASIIAGARVPIVLTSRSDSEMSKLYSIALASALNR